MEDGISLQTISEETASRLQFIIDRLDALCEVSINGIPYSCSSYDGQTFHVSEAIRVQSRREITLHDKIRWLKKNHILNRFYKNSYDKKVMNDKTPQLIQKAFDWSGTKEGFQFWNNINGRYEDWFIGNFYI